MSVIADESIGAFDFDDITERKISPTLDLSIPGLHILDRLVRDRAHRLSPELFWRALGHPSVLYLIDKLATSSPDEYRAAYEELLNAFEYVIKRIVWRTAKGIT